MPLFTKLEKYNFKENDQGMKVLQNVYININYENVLYLTCNWYPSHSHIMQDLIWQFSYYFQLKKNYQNIVLILDSNNVNDENSDKNISNGLSENFIKSLLNLLEISYIFLKDIQIYKNPKRKTFICKNFFYNKDLRHYQFDLSDNDLSYFDDKAFFYKNLYNNEHPDVYQSNFLLKCNVNKRFLEIINIIKKKFNEKKIILDEKYNNIYFSRRNDVNKFYHMDNIENVSDQIIKKYKAFEFEKLWKISIYDKIK